MLSIPDMAMLGAAALIFFGPEQLPKVARKVGTIVRDVQNTSQSFIREMEAAADRSDPPPPPPPPAPPVEPLHAETAHAETAHVETAHAETPHAETPHDGAPAPG
jgi:sec-independent protein translocase protein TatA